MFKYFHIIKFLMTHDLTELKEYWSCEILHGKRFSWIRLMKTLLRNQLVRYEYLFWFRMVNHMYMFGNDKLKKIAIKLNQKLINKYNIEIGLGAKIGRGLTLTHLSGIVITGYIEIGCNFTIKQNCTIGIKTIYETHGKWSDDYKIIIGNNVFIGAGSNIISDNLQVGNNVYIGAMSYISKNIPDNCTVYTKKINEMIVRDIN